jgi:prevent-host-death family protein
MDIFLTATEARQRFLKLLAGVKEGERIIITHRGKPAAAVIDFERRREVAPNPPVNRTRYSRPAFAGRLPATLAHRQPVMCQIQTGEIKSAERR